MVKELTFEELEYITGGEDVSSGLGNIIAGSALAGTGVKVVYTAATASKAITIIGMSCSPALVAIGGAVLLVAGVGLTVYGFGMLDD